MRPGQMYVMAALAEDKGIIYCGVATNYDTALTAQAAGLVIGQLNHSFSKPFDVVVLSHCTHEPIDGLRLYVYNATDPAHVNHVTHMRRVGDKFKIMRVNPALNLQHAQ